MFHIAAYYDSALGTVADTDISAVQDPVVQITNNHFVFQQARQLVFAYAGSATLARTKVVTPTTRQITNPYIRTINVGLNPVSPPCILDGLGQPFQLRALEETAVQASAAPATTEPFFAILGLQQSYQPAPQGDIYTLRGTGSVTVTAAAWTQCAITWQDNLPAGQYAAIGMEFYSATAIAARLIFGNQVDRPGCIGITALSHITHPMFRRGGLGLWGGFPNTRMPSLEVLCSGADTTQEVYLDLVRIG